jgi:hypothetical protein
MTTLPPQNITAIGTFLTLVSLLGAFFYVHLTNWLRDLLALRAKFELNAGGNTAPEEQALRECRYILHGLYNVLPGLITCAVSVFIAFVAWQSYGILLPYLCTDPLAERLAQSLGLFLAIYVALVAFLLGRGYWIGHAILVKLEP